jgi:hypothetical protein
MCTCRNLVVKVPDWDMGTDEHPKIESSVERRADVDTALAWSVGGLPALL